MVADLTASAARTILKTCLRCFDAIFRRAEAGPGRAEAWAGRAEAQNGGFLIWSKTCVSAEAIATFFLSYPIFSAGAAASSFFSAGTGAASGASG